MPEGGHDASRALWLNSRVLPRSLSFCRRSGVWSFCRCGSPSTGTSLFLYGWTFSSACSSCTCRGCWRSSGWRCSRLQWLRPRYFLLIVFGFFRLLAPRVAVPQCLFYVRLVSSLGFLYLCAFFFSSFRVFFAQAKFCIFSCIYCFVHICFACYLARSAVKLLLHRRLYFSMVPYAYISFAGVCSPPLC